MCTLGCFAFGFPDPVLIGVVVAVSALVPLIGATIGMIIGFLLICVKSFPMAIGFVVFLLVLMQIDVNFTGAVRLIQAILPTLRAQQGGRIIFTSSVAAILSVPYQSFYSASKAAINKVAIRDVLKVDMPLKGRSRSHTTPTPSIH